MPLKSAIVAGCGVAGRGWIKALQADLRCEVVGLVDIRPEAARTAAEEHGLSVAVTFGRLDTAIRAVRPDFVCDITVRSAPRDDLDRTRP